MSNSSRTRRINSPPLRLAGGPILEIADSLIYTHRAAAAESYAA